MLFCIVKFEEQIVLMKCIFIPVSKLEVKNKSLLWAAVEKRLEEVVNELNSCMHAHTLYLLEGIAVILRLAAFCSKISISETER